MSRRLIQKRAKFASKQKARRKRGNRIFMTKREALDIVARRMAMMIDRMIYESLTKSASVKTLHIGQ